MPYWVVTGKLGSGKTLVTIGKMHDYMRQGRRVASNIDLDMDQIYKKGLKTIVDYTRVPDKPTCHDMDMLGNGYDVDSGYDEHKTGLIVLDELATWLNARSWNDPDRKAFIDWCVHARKLGWDVIFIVQDVSMIDKQVRDALCEYLVICKRTDRVKLFGFKPPKVHVGKVYYGDTATGDPVERWFYRGKEYYSAYDTAQVFSAMYDKSTYCPLRTYYFTDEKDLPLKEKSKIQQYLEPQYLIIAGLVILNIYLLSSEDSTANIQIEEKPRPLSKEVEIDLLPKESVFDQFGSMRISGEINIGDKKTVYIETEKMGTITNKELTRFLIKANKLHNCFYQLHYLTERKYINCDSKTTEEDENIKSIQVRPATSAPQPG
jgi:hypothetical protein